jgi:putative transposase
VSAETIGAMARSGVISNEFWQLIEPLMQSDVGRRGGRLGDHRLILEGIGWRFGMGSPWRNLPEEFGGWQTVWKRHHRFSIDGTCRRMLDAARERHRDDELVEGLARLWSVDSIVVDAHQHAAGAPAARDTGG